MVKGHKHLDWLLFNEDVNMYVYITCRCLTMHILKPITEMPSSLYSIREFNFDVSQLKIIQTSLARDSTSSGRVVFSIQGTL